MIYPYVYVDIYGTVGVLLCVSMSDIADSEFLQIRVANIKTQGSIDIFEGLDIFC